MSVVPLDKFFRGRDTASNMLDKCIEKYNRSLTTVICPRCLSENVAPKGFAERLNGEVRGYCCRDCKHRFTENWKPIRLQAISQETVNLLLTLACYGIGINEMSELMLTVQEHEEIKKPTLHRLLYKIADFLSMFEQTYMRLCGGFPAENLAVFAVRRSLKGGSKVGLVCSADLDSAFWITAIPGAAACAETVKKLKDLVRGEPKRIICSDLVENSELIKKSYPSSSFEIAPQIPAAGKSYFNRLVSLMKTLSKSVPKNISYPSIRLLEMRTTISRAYYNFLRRADSRKKKPLVEEVGLPWPEKISNWTLLLRFGYIVMQAAKLKGCMCGGGMNQE